MANAIVEGNQGYRKCRTSISKRVNVEEGSAE